MNNGLRSNARFAGGYRTYDPMFPPLNAPGIGDEFDFDFQRTATAPPGWQNVGTLTPTSTVRLGWLDLESPSSFSNNTCGIERGYLPPGPFTLATRINSMATGRYNVVGLYIRSAASGRFVSVGQFTRSNAGLGDQSCIWERWNNFGSRNSNGGDSFVSGHIHYTRLSFDGTNLYGEISRDGISWYLYYQEAMTVWFTAGQIPDRFGVKITPFENSIGRAGFAFVRYFPTPFADIGRMITVEG